MIESCYWKEELRRISNDLRRKKNPPIYSIRRMCLAERDIIVGFFIIRRMVELQKVTNKTGGFKFDVVKYLPKKSVHKLNVHHHWETYDLEAGMNETMTAFDASNQFIHSATIFIHRDKNRNWSHVHLVSDWRAREGLYRIEIGAISELFSIASQDYAHSMHYTWDQKANNYSITVS